VSLHSSSQSLLRSMRRAVCALSALLVVCACLAYELFTSSPIFLPRAAFGRAFDLGQPPRGGGIVGLRITETPVTSALAVAPKVPDGGPPTSTALLHPGRAEAQRGRGGVPAAAGAAHHPVQATGPSQGLDWGSAAASRQPSCSLPAAANRSAVANWSAVFAGLAPHRRDAHVAQAYHPWANSTLLVESDLSAWNNIRMSWEMAVCLAFKTRRLYRVPHIPVESYADIRLKFHRNGELRKLNMFDYYDEESFRRVVPAALDSDPLPAGRVFIPDRDPWSMPIEQFNSLNHTHLIYRGGGEHIRTRVFGQFANDPALVPHGFYVSLVQRAFRLRWDLICRTVARLVAYGLSPLDYVAVHRRRGDSVNIAGYNVIARAAAEHIAPLVRNKTVLVVTDTYEPNFLRDLRNVSGAARVVCWADRRWTGDDEVYATQVDMLAAVAARTFIASPASTFSTGIVRWRVQAGTHKLGDPVHFTKLNEVGYAGWPSPGAKGTFL